MPEKKSNVSDFTDAQLLRELSKRGILKSIAVEKRLSPVEVSNMPDPQVRSMSVKAFIASEIAKFLVHGKGATFMDANMFTDDKGELYEVELHVVKPAPEILGVMQ